MVVPVFMGLSNLYNVPQYGACTEYGVRSSGYVSVFVWSSQIYDKYAYSVKT